MSKRMFGRRLFAVCFLASTLIAVAVRAGDLEVHFINVGQGDCTLVVFPSGKRMLVDCGSLGGNFDGDRVREYIKQRLDANYPRIDLLLITHPDRDHYNKLPEVLGDPDEPLIRVSKVMYSGTPDEYDSSGMDVWLDSFPKSKRIVVKNDTYNVYPAKKLPGFTNDGVVVLAANVESGFSPTNARSIVLKITHGTFDVMLTGDATLDTDESILERFQNHMGELDVEVWKAAHHGSSATASENSAWADAVRPEVVVFSAALQNGFGHPNRILASKFKEYTVPAAAHSITMWEKKGQKSTEAAIEPYKTESMFLTATSGDIIVKSNGQNWTTTFNPN